MAYGNEAGLVIVDIVQKVCLFNVASPDLYGAQDPYSRVPRSPKRLEPYSRDEQARSPSIDQVSWRVYYNSVYKMALMIMFTFKFT